MHFLYVLCGVINSNLQFKTQDIVKEGTLSCTILSYNCYIAEAKRLGERVHNLKRFQLIEKI